MSNRSYNPTGAPTFAGPGSSKTIRDEFSSIGTGFAEIETEINNIHSQPTLPGFVSITYAVSGDTVRLEPGIGSLVIKTDTGSGVVTVLPPVGQYFADGSTKYELILQYEALVFANNGVNYYQVMGGTVVPVSAGPVAVVLDAVAAPSITLNHLVTQYTIVRNDSGSTGSNAAIRAPFYPQYSIDGAEYAYLTVNGEVTSLIQVDNGNDTFTWRSH